ncbi:hypothetical protein B0H12DRAFT_51762 [Mycena haematopus]|nr:hypothetical protein B0H12DRAFT_51762 [Mycena haematopus]
MTLTPAPRSIDIPPTATSGVSATNIITASHSPRPAPTHPLHSEKQKKAPVGLIVGVALAIVAAVLALFFVRYLFIRLSGRRGGFIAVMDSGVSLYIHSKPYPTLRDTRTYLYLFRGFMDEYRKCNCIVLLPFFPSPDSHLLASPRLASMAHPLASPQRIHAHAKPPIHIPDRSSRLPHTPVSSPGYICRFLRAQQPLFQLFFHSFLVLPSPPDIVIESRSSRPNQDENEGLACLIKCLEDTVLFTVHAYSILSGCAASTHSRS